MRFSEAIAQVNSELSAVEDLDGDIPDELIPRWNLAVTNLKEAVDTRAFQIRQVQAMKASLDAIIKGIQRKKKNFERYEERLLEYTKYALTQNPELEFKGNLHAFSLCKNSACSIEYSVTFQKPPLLIDPFDVAKFPAEYVTSAQLFVLDKERFEAALRAGLTCDGARLGERGTHVRIR